jgi:signal transduction histidine kinase
VKKDSDMIVIKSTIFTIFCWHLTLFSQKVIDKIFQPFFTTKPTGQGTGLGLSLSYDIIKAHGGVIRVETAEGEGTTFFVQLPITS